MGRTARPHSPLAEAKSYSERLFLFERIEHLDNQGAAAALTQPASSEGVDWDEDAVAFIVNQSMGYPYFLQEFGQDTWDAAQDERITLSDARVGAAHGRAALDTGFPRPLGPSYPRGTAVPA